jgi:hypothetical protein
LTGELNEFDAAVSPREGVPKGVRLGGPESGIALSLPFAVKGSKPGSPELPVGRGEVQIWGRCRAMGLPLTGTEEPLLIHAGGFNLGLLVRSIIGVGTPRGLQGRLAVVSPALILLVGSARRHVVAVCSSHRLIMTMRGWISSPTMLVINSSAAATCTTGPRAAGYLR